MERSGGRPQRARHISTGSRGGASTARAQWRNRCAARARREDSGGRGVAVVPRQSGVGLAVERGGSRPRRARHVGAGPRGGASTAQVQWRSRYAGRARREDGGGDGRRRPSAEDPAIRSGPVPRARGQRLEVGEISRRNAASHGGGPEILRRELVQRQLGRYSTEQGQRAPVAAEKEQSAG